jgi:hypothetical protein
MFKLFSIFLFLLEKNSFLGPKEEKKVALSIKAVAYHAYLYMVWGVLGPQKPLRAFLWAGRKKRKKGKKLGY